MNKLTLNEPAKIFYVSVLRIKIGPKFKIQEHILSIFIMNTSIPLDIKLNSSLTVEWIAVYRGDAVVGQNNL